MTDAGTSVIILAVSVLAFAIALACLIDKILRLSKRVTQDKKEEEDK